MVLTIKRQIYGYLRCFEIILIPTNPLFKRINRPIKGQTLLTLRLKLKKDAR